MSTRRDFVFGSMGAAGLLSFGLPGALRLAHAASTPSVTDRYFLFCYFNGGWDTLLGLDPRDPALFPDELRNETLIEPGYGNLRVPGVVPELIEAGGMTFGPFIGGLADWADRLAVVRGMSMDTLTHEVGRRRFLTGKPPSGLLARGSSVSTVLASLLGVEQPVPQLSAKVESYNIDQPAWSTALRVDNVNDLLRALRPGDVDIAADERARIQALLDGFRDCDVVGESVALDAALSSQGAARTLVDQGIDAAFDFSAPAMEGLRTRFGIDPNNLGSAQAQGAMAVTALTQGVSRVVSIQVASGLDTHFDNWETDHGPVQQEGFDVVASIMSELDSLEYQGTGASWLDHTTIVGFSEFSRTALLNGNGGRDHALTNSCFLAGAGIKPGVVGASSDVGLLPQAIDLASGQVDPAGEVVRPEHILRALLHSIGVDDDIDDLRVDPLTALLS